MTTARDLVQTWLRAKRTGGATAADHHDAVAGLDHRLAIRIGDDDAAAAIYPHDEHRAVGLTLDRLDALTHQFAFRRRLDQFHLQAQGMQHLFEFAHSGRAVDE